MFDAIRSILGDIASGAVKDQRIALSQEQLTALDSRLKVLEGELSEAHRKVAALEAENANLKARIQHAQQVKQLSPDQRKVLEFLNGDTTDNYIDFELIARHARLDLPKARFVLEQLEELDYVWGTTYSPPGYHISPKGRAFLYDSQ